MKRFLLLLMLVFSLGLTSNLYSQLNQCPPENATPEYGSMGWSVDTVWLEMEYLGRTCLWRFIYCHRMFPHVPIIQVHIKGYKPVDDNPECMDTAYINTLTYGRNFQLTHNFLRLAANRILKENPKSHYWPIPHCCNYETPPCCGLPSPPCNGSPTPPYQYQHVNSSCYYTEHGIKKYCSSSGAYCVEIYKKCSDGVDTAFDFIETVTVGSCSSGCTFECD